MAVETYSSLCIVQVDITAFSAFDSYQSTCLGICWTNKLNVSFSSTKMSPQEILFIYVQSDFNWIFLKVEKENHQTYFAIVQKHFSLVWPNNIPCIYILYKYICQLIVGSTPFVFKHIWLLKHILVFVLCI